MAVSAVADTAQVNMRRCQEFWNMSSSMDIRNG